MTLHCNSMGGGGRQLQIQMTMAKFDGNCSTDDGSWRLCKAIQMEVAGGQRRHPEQVAELVEVAAVPPAAASNGG